MNGTTRIGLAGAMIGLAVSAGTASAQGMFEGRTYYLKGFVGLTVPQDDSFQLHPDSGTGVIDTGFDYDSGYIAGGAFGYNATPNVAVELEYAYRNADVSFDVAGADDGSTKSNAVMANVIYKFSPMGPGSQWQPYAGAGLGAANLKAEGVGPGGQYASDFTFAYQAIGGIGYVVSPELTLSGEARFFGMNDQDLDNGGAHFKTSYQTFDLLFGVTYTY